MTEPPVYYKGNKNIPGTIQKILNHIPAASVFIELFSGSASVSQYIAKLDQPPRIMLNDLSAAVQSFHSILPAEFFNLDFRIFIESQISLLDRFSASVFVDPPYLHSTRVNSLCLYDHELTTDDHLQLISSLLAMEQNIIIIHPSCELYNDSFSTWHKSKVSIRYHRKTSIEIIYTNFSPDLPLMYPYFIGSDCWDRQRIKRKVFRTIQKVSSLPPGERQFLFSSLASKFPELTYNPSFINPFYHE